LIVAAAILAGALLLALVSSYSNAQEPMALVEFSPTWHQTLPLCLRHFRFEGHEEGALAVEDEFTGNRFCAVDQLVAERFNGQPLLFNDC
jgi:hypothetical protein